MYDTLDAELNVAVATKQRRQGIYMKRTERDGRKLVNNEAEIVGKEDAVDSARVFVDAKGTKVVTEAERSALYAGALAVPSVIVAADREALQLHGEQSDALDVALKAAEVDHLARHKSADAGAEEEDATT